MSDARDLLGSTKQKQTKAAARRSSSSTLGHIRHRRLPARSAKR